MKEYKYLSALFLLLIISFSLHGQYLNDLLFEDGDECLGLSVIYNENDFIVVGKMYYYNESYSDLYFGSFTHEGELNYVKFYGDDIYIYFPGFWGSLTKTHDGGYALCGGMNDSYESMANLMRFNPVGDTLWMKTYRDTMWITGRMCIQTHDAGFALLCTSSDSISYETSLIKTDSLGNEKWRNIFWYPYSELGYDILQTPDSGFLISGMNYVGGQYISRDPFIMRTDKNGQLQWRMNIGDSIRDSWAKICDGDSGYYMAAAVIGDTMGGAGGYDGRITIFMFDAFENIIWEKKFCCPYYNNTVFDIEKCSDSGYIICGVHSSSTISWMLKINNNGDSIWYREYEYPPAITNEMLDLSTNGNKIVTIGSAVGGEVYLQRTWMVATDSLGCDFPGCDTLVGIPLAFDQEKRDCKVIPNPVTGTSKVQLSAHRKHAATLSIFDVWGRLLLIKTYGKNEEMELHNSDYKPGIYFIKIMDEDGDVYSGKFVVVE